eukprot:354419-Chlamydomonas_euryale.AAC.2
MGEEDAPEGLHCLPALSSQGMAPFLPFGVDPLQPHPSESGNTLLRGTSSALSELNKRRRQKACNQYCGVVCQIRFTKAALSNWLKPG